MPVDFLISAVSTAYWGIGKQNDQHIEWNQPYGCKQVIDLNKT